MSVDFNPARKQTVNLTLNESQVLQTKTDTSNLPTTMELPSAEFVSQQQQAPHSRQQLADACVADWNAVHASVGSFADEYVSL